MCLDNIQKGLRLEEVFKPRAFGISFSDYNCPFVIFYASNGSTKWIEVEVLEPTKQIVQPTFKSVLKNSSIGLAKY